MAWSDAARRAAIEARRRHKGRLVQVNRLYGSMRHQDKRLLYGESSQSLGQMYGLDKGQARLFQRKLNAGSGLGAAKAGASSYGASQAKPNYGAATLKKSRQRQKALRAKQRLDQAYEDSIKAGLNAGKKRGGF